MPNDTDFKKQIEANLHSFLSGNLKQNALRFLETLGYESDKKIDLQPNTAEGFRAFLKQNSEQLVNEKKAHLDEWETVDFLFQLTDEEISRTKSLFDSSNVDVSDKRIESYLFFAIKLKEDVYRRSELAEITREINRIFPMPVMILFRHGDTLTFSIIDRRLHKKDSTKDVLEKVTLIKDIRLENPHRAHVEILSDLALNNLKVKNFVELHKEWQRVLDTKELNKKFFQELANWYFWTVDNSTFPADEEKDKDVRNATNVIRLITRLMFVWFLKEKGLVSEKLFNEKELKKILRFKDDSAYYKAILQNLFFATLNSEMNSRKFIAESSGGRNTQHFVHNVFRYQREFIKPEETIKELFEPIPFLNGGLFECLDKETEVDGTKCRVRVDGFSDHPKNVLEIPDELFFGSERQIELNEIYGTKNKKYKVRGLINILNSYKFTITENTPIEEEIALDPELLGKVFENLLANFNPETKTTARKQTGSFYTPREIVNYMVDESLLAYLKAKLQTETEGFAGFVAFGENQPTMFGNEARIQQKFETAVSNNRWHGKDESLETALRKLFSYTEDKHEFNETETEILLKAIDECKILDPACGSGAFPMGILHRLVHLLGKLDKDNEKWREWQRLKAIKDTEEAYEIGDHKEREERLLEINDVFENNASDYGRKLFLIENCIYGVDIQPIAIQIAKLRFFISLIVDQKTDKEKKNLGILPLPNLETKFVAANTLISLEESSQITFARNAVRPQETELKKVRSEIFRAKSYSVKKKWREKEKNIRREIAGLLKENNFFPDAADKIAEWQPDNQNYSAKWFDAEWMFGIEKGFDIVIGNPPYVVSKDAKLKQIYRESIFGRPNLYGFFIHHGLQSSLAKNGLLTFINPRTLLTDAYFSALRKFIRKDFSVELILNIIDRRNVFESVLQSCVVNIFRNKTQSKELIVKTIQTKNDIGKQNEIKVNSTDFFFGDKKSPLFLVAEKKSAYDLMKKIKTFNTFEKAGIEFTTGKIQWDLYAETLAPNPKSNATLLIWAENIQRYYFAPAKNRAKKLYINSPLRTCQPITQETIVVQRTTAVEQEFRIISTIVSPENFGLPIQAENNTSYLVSNNGYKLKVILAFLSSQFMDYFFRLTNSNTHVSAGELNDLPIPKATESQQTEIAEIVDEIIEAKKQNPNADTSKLEGKIDALVYQLYGLTDEEIRIVEGKD